MPTSLFQICDKTFLACCIIATISFTSFCIYQYQRNDDTSVISFRKFHENENSVYPALVLCFGDYLKHDAFHNDTHENRYKSFLEGKFWDDEMAKIDYEDVTIDIHGYIIEMQMYILDFETAEEPKMLRYNPNKSEKISGNWTPNIYPTNIYPLYRCWTFEINFVPNENILYFGLVLNSAVFKS